MGQGEHDREYDRVEVEPEPSAFLDRLSAASGGAAWSATVDRADVDYRARAAQFEQAYDEAVPQLRRWNPPAERFFRQQLELPGRTVTVVYDDLLDRRLLEIYVLHGWQGIRRVQRAFDAAANNPYMKDLQPWSLIRAFLDYTRNLLLLRIRTALVEIERLAADQLVTQLASTESLVKETTRALDLRPSPRDAAGREERVRSSKPSPSCDTPLYELRTFYLFGNRELGDRLLPKVQTAVEALQKLRETQEQLRKADEGAEAWREFKSDIGAPPAGYAQDQKTLPGEIAAQSATVEEAYRGVQAICELALLAVPLLQSPVTLTDLGEVLHQALRNLEGHAEKLRGALAGSTSWVTALAPMREGPLEERFPAELCLEETAVQSAIERVGDDPSRLSLLREETLLQLVERGLVAKDDFRYVVLSHTVAALLAALAREREREEAVRGLFEGLARIASLVSLALWITPAGGVARGVSACLGLGLLAFQTYSVVHQLSLVDRELAYRLAGLDAQRAEEVVAVSEIARLRPEYLGEVSATLAKELGLIAAAQALPQLKLVLHLRGYYADLETLVGD